MNGLEAFSEFQQLMARLSTRSGGLQTIECLQRKSLKRSGIYFFYEPGEVTEGGQPRVVRVGTHGLAANARSTLGSRLRQHGGARAGTGNHRGSIFRLLVGEALMSRGDVPPVASWGKGADVSAGAVLTGVPKEVIKHAEAPVERAVSATIRAMSVLLLPVEEPVPGRTGNLEPHEARGFIERSAIALLSAPSVADACPPSVRWLGRHSSRARVRDSGLWNQNHVGEAWDPAFLELMGHLIARGTFL